MENKKKIDAANILLDRMEVSGVGVLAVEDGHVFAFKTAKLQELIDSVKGKDSLVIFVKRGPLTTDPAVNN